MTSPAKPNRWDAILEQSAASFLSSHLADAVDHHSGEIAGTVVGPYRLVEEIGHGGMGTVWLAERADGHFEQRVAVKLVRRGMDTDDILERFVRERQILARLEHPHIARLLDGGVTAQGRPYFVMEHIAGEPITTYCDARQLPVENRLRLFVVACRAVQQAHRSLVVHRDLKPSNVMVTTDGEVKLLDFGVAKLLEEGADLATHAGPMTPEYASPEQLAGRPVTTASDVYQLGVLLYELLSGHRPWGSRRGDQADAEPPRPSTATRRVEQVVRTGGETHTIDPEGVSASRGSTPARLFKRLRGDLDTIALTALRHEPEHRYPSADALADDIERHLASLPLRVRDGDLAYRARRFVRRYRWRVGSAAAATLALVGTVAFYGVRIRQERDTALLEAAKSAANAELVRQVFSAWSPDAANRSRVSATTIVRNAVRRAEREYQDQPELLASSLSTLGELFTNLGDFAAADSLLGRALAEQDRPGRTAHPDLAASLARRGRLQAQLGNSADALRLLRRALRMYEAVLGGRRMETLRVRRDLGVQLRTAGVLPEAEAMLRSVLDTVSADARESPFALEVGADLGYVLFLRANYDAAVALLRATLEKQRLLFGPQYAPAMQTARFLASALRDRGDLAESEQLNREALDLCRTLYGERHTQTTIAKIVLSILLERQGRFEEAEQLSRDALTILRPHDQGTAMEIMRLGSIRLDRGDAVEGGRLLRRGLDSLRRVFPSGTPDEADALNRLAYVALSHGEPDAARLYEEAAAFDRNRPPGSPDFVSDGVHFLAWAHHQRGRLAEAEAVYRRALAIYRVQLPSDHPYTLFAVAGLKRVLVDQGRRDEANAISRP